jgi:uncharacterized membrane protein YoaK (UPF0700 family)
MHHTILLLLLTCAAGCVDAISYLGLGHVFTAMMTGNTVLLGLALGQGHVLAAVRSIVALIGFSAGVILGAIIVQRQAGDSPWPVAVTQALALEAALLGAFALLWHFTGPERGESLLYVLIGLTAVAMGLQSAAVQRLGVPGVMTTYITGTLTSLMADVGKRLRARAPRTKAATTPSIPGRRVGVLAAVFVVYGCGALAGGLLELHSFSFAVGIPFLAVASVVVSALWIESSPRG